MSSSISSCSAGWSEILNGGIKDREDKQKSLINENLPTLKKNLTEIRKHRSYEFYVTPTEISTEDKTFPLALQTDKSFLEDMLNNKTEFPLIRLSSQKLKELKNGEKVLARWSVDFKIYRAKIEEILVVERTNTRYYNVRFVDYGNSEKQVEGTSLFYYHPDLDKIWFQSIMASLSKNYDRNLIKQICLELKSCHSVIYCKIEELEMENNPQASVTILQSNDEVQGEITSLNTNYCQNLEEEKISLVTNWLKINDFESSESQYSEDITIRTDDIVDEQLFKFKDQRRLSGSITDKESEETEISEENSILSGPKSLEIQDASSRDPVYLDLCFQSVDLDIFQCYVIKYLGPKNFFIRTNTGQMLLNEITKALSEADWQNFETISLDLLKTGSCWALKSKDRDLVRVKLLKDATSTSVSVYLLDYGGVRRALTSDLAWLPQGIATTTGGLALHCCMANEGDYQLKSSAESFIHRNLVHKQGIKMFVDRFDELINIFYVHVIIGDSNLMDIMIRSGFTQGDYLESDSDNNDNDYFDDFGEDDSGVNIADYWDPMADDFYDRKNTVENLDTDPEVAIMGRSDKDDYCPKFLLYGKCPKGDFCPLKNKHIEGGGKVKVYQSNSKLLNEKQKEKVAISYLRYSPPYDLIVIKQSVNDDFQEYSIKDITQLIEEPRNERLDRTLRQNLGKLIGVRSSKYGWVRARIIEEDVNDRDEDVYLLYLIDFGVDLTSKFGPTDVKELVPSLQDIPPLAIKGLPQQWRNPNFLDKVKAYLESPHGRSLFVEILPSQPDGVLIQLYEKLDGQFVLF